MLLLTAVRAVTVQGYGLSKRLSFITLIDVVLFGGKRQQNNDFEGDNLHILYLTAHLQRL